MMASHANPSSTGLDFLVQKRRVTAFVLLAIGAALGLGSIWPFKATGWNYFPVGVGMGFLALLSLAAGFFQLMRQPDQFPEPEITRMLVLGLGGLFGLVTSLIGLILTLDWWDVYLNWLKAEPGKDGWKMWVSLA